SPSGCFVAMREVRRLRTGDAGGRAGRGRAAARCELSGSVGGGARLRRRYSEQRAPVGALPGRRCRWELAAADDLLGQGLGDLLAGGGRSVAAGARSRIGCATELRGRCRRAGGSRRCSGGRAPGPRAVRELVSGERGARPCLHRDGSSGRHRRGDPGPSWTGSRIPEEPGVRSRAGGHLPDWFLPGPLQRAQRDHRGVRRFRSDPPSLRNGRLDCRCSGDIRRTAVPEQPRRGGSSNRRTRDDQRASQQPSCAAGYGRADCARHPVPEPPWLCSDSPLTARRSPTRTLPKPPDFGYTCGSKIPTSCYWPLAGLSPCSIQLPGRDRRYGGMVSNYKITATDDAASSLPPVLRVSAAVSWRCLVICGAIFVLGQIISRLFVVVIPVAIALLLAALLGPAVGFLARHGVPRALATVVVMVGGLAAVGSVLTFVINAFIQGFPDLQQQVIRSINTLREQLATGPLHLTDQQLGQYLDQAQQWLQRNQAQITSWSLATATTFGNFLTGLLLALFTLIFFLYDGRRLWLFLIKLAPKHVRHRVDLAGCRAFDSLIGFVRGTALVAVVDAVGIGLGLGILGVPLAVPLAALVFLG